MDRELDILYTDEHACALIAQLGARKPDLEARKDDGIGKPWTICTLVSKGDDEECWLVAIYPGHELLDITRQKRGLKYQGVDSKGFIGRYSSASVWLEMKSLVMKHVSKAR